MRTNWLESVYSDGSETFVQPALPKKGEDVTVSIRFFADAPVQAVMLRTRINGGEERLHMQRGKEKDGLVYYSVKVSSKEDCFHYHFYASKALFLSVYVIYAIYFSYCFYYFI